MKFGINTFLWTSRFGESHLRVLDQVKSHGFDGVEVSLFEPADFEAKAIRTGLAERELGCTVCSVLPARLSLLADDEAVRRQTVAHLRDCAHAAAESGASLIAGPLYSPVGFLPGRRRTPDEWKRCIDGYQQLGPALQETGVHIAIEPLNRFETYFLNLAADAVELCNAIDHPNVGLLFDTFHANIEEKSVDTALLTAGARLKHIHTCENDRGTPGSGHVDWNGVFESIRALRYDGWLTIESFGFALGELSAAASIWRDLAPEPDQIAWEGVKFLKWMANAA